MSENNIKQTLENLLSEVERLQTIEKRYRELLLEKSPEQTDHSAVHLHHCNIGEYEGSCKYGDENCPALDHAALKAKWAPVQKMTAERAAYFMDRFRHEEKLLGPNEQAAVAFVIDMLTTQPTEYPPPTPPYFTTGHCKEHSKPGGCQLHNVQCGYPQCDRKPVHVCKFQGAVDLHTNRTWLECPECGARKDVKQYQPVAQIVFSEDNRVMTKQNTFTPSQLAAFEQYVLMLLETVDAVHVTTVIPVKFDQFPTWVPTNPSIEYETRTGWIRKVVAQ